MEASQHVVYSDRIDKAVRLAYGCIKSISSTPSDFDVNDIFVVWFNKTLQNWKAIVSAGFPGAPLVEVSYNGDKRETYIDIYKKIENVAIPD